MKLRIINGKTVKAQIQWEPRDLWVGLFWRINREMPTPYYTLHLYVCIVPLIRVSFASHSKHILAYLSTHTSKMGLWIAFLFHQHILCVSCGENS